MLEAQLRPERGHYQVEESIHRSIVLHTFHQSRSGPESRDTIAWNRTARSGPPDLFSHGICAPPFDITQERSGSSDFEPSQVDLVLRDHPCVRGLGGPPHWILKEKDRIFLL